MSPYEIQKSILEQIHEYRSERFCEINYFIIKHGVAQGFLVLIAIIETNYIKRWIVSNLFIKVKINKYRKISL